MTMFAGLKAMLFSSASARISGSGHPGAAAGASDRADFADVLTKAAGKTPALITRSAPDNAARADTPTAPDPDMQDGSGDPVQAGQNGAPSGLAGVAPSDPPVTDSIAKPRDTGPGTHKPSPQKTAVVNGAVPNRGVVRGETLAGERGAVIAQDASDESGLDDDAPVAIALAPEAPLAMPVPLPSPPPAPVNASGDVVAVPSPIAATDTAPALPAAAQPDAVKPGMITPERAEALSLLQLVRDHMTRRPGTRSGADAPAAPVERSKGAAPPDNIAMVPPLVTLADTAPLAGASASAPASGVLLTAAAPDLSASLGTQVVDMGVAGQWIDRLARDIAGLSANGAQGRFQIDAPQLGSVQVDIRQGADGASVSLTVATDAAEQALRQDGERLRLDGGLSGVRIADVKIERAPHGSDVVRADPSSPSAAASSSSAGQGMAQSHSQGQFQGRWQPRENIASVRKAGSDPSVLNPVGAGDSTGDVVRARYA